jgi:predicted double-glycine peptidase
MLPTPVFINLPLIVLFAAAGVAEGRRLLARHRDMQLETALRKAPYLYALVPLSVLLLAVTVALMVVGKMRPSYFWALPVWFEYHLYTVMWGSIISLFSFTFALTSAIAVLSGHSEGRKIIAASLLFVTAIQVMVWTYTRPVAPELREEISPSGLVSQTSPVSCAAASGATILRLLGEMKTEKEVARLFGTSMLGSSAAQIIVGMEKMGFSSRKMEIDNCDPERLVPPAMLFVDNPFIGPESHAVALLGFQQGEAQIWDPLTGAMMGLGKEEAAEFWRGRAIEFQKVDE